MRPGSQTSTEEYTPGDVFKGLVTYNTVGYCIASVGRMNYAMLSFKGRHRDLRSQISHLLHFNFGDFPVGSPRSSIEY